MMKSIQTFMSLPGLLWLVRKRFLGFGLVGIAIMMMGMVLLYALVQFGRIEQNLAYFIQAIVSIEANFCLNKFLNWRDRKGNILTQWVKFHTTKIGTVALNQCLFAGLVQLGIHYLVVTLVGVAVATIINYIINDKFVFLSAAPRGRSLHPF